MQPHGRARQVEPMGKHSGPSHSGNPPGRRIDHHTQREAHKPSQDAYHHERKGAKAFVCTECGVACHAGAWSWKGPPLTDVESGLCPACKRIRDDYPAGVIELRGLVGSEREEVLASIRHQEEAEKGEHPLERIMRVREDGAAIVVTTTGVHLGRAIAGALGRRYKNQVRVDYPPGENRIHVRLEH